MSNPDFVDLNAYRATDIDIRTLLKYDQPYPVNHWTYCTVCGDDTDQGTITKHHHKKFPPGRLMTRCPEHQRRREEKLARS